MQLKIFHKSAKSLPNNPRYIDDYLPRLFAHAAIFITKITAKVIFCNFVY